LTDNDFRLLFAASLGNIQVLEILNKESWKVNVYDLDGRTPLHLAACSDNLEAVKYLVSHGADVMARD
jgi:glutaminase